MNEKLLEKKLREGVKARHGLAVKFFAPTFTGLPDRILLLPGGRIRFAEVKTTGEEPSDRQLVVHAQLRALGFTVDVIDDQTTLDNLLNAI